MLSWVLHDKFIPGPAGIANGIVLLDSRDYLESALAEIKMARGTVKWFNSQKGYGFIQPQGGGKDVFVHISAVEKAGLSNLNEGQVVEYEEVANKGKTSAENLKVQR
jgi:cold shock protein